MNMQHGSFSSFLRGLKSALSNVIFLSQIQSLANHTHDSLLDIMVFDVVGDDDDGNDDHENGYD